MTGKNLKFTGDINRFKQFLNPQVWSGNLEREIKRATIKNSLYLIKEIKEQMRKKGAFPENSPLTLMTSKSDNPLLDNKNLWNAIDTVLKTSFESEVGILTNKGSTGSKFGNARSQINIKDLVELMESGYTITVTNKMKKAIAASLNSASKEGSKKAKKNASVASQRLRKIYGGKEYVVPPRPIFSSVFENPSIEKQLQANWRAALEGTFKAQGAKGGEHKDR